MKIIRPIDIVTARVPLIQIDATEIDDPQERRQILNDRKIDDVARPMFNRTNLDPCRARRRRALHKKEFTRGAVRVTLHDHCPVLQMREQHRCDIGIVLKQISFGDFELRPEKLL